jgi:hypothetical protein
MVPGKKCFAYYFQSLAGQQATKSRTLFKYQAPPFEIFGKPDVIKMTSGLFLVSYPYEAEKYF